MKNNRNKIYAFDLFDTLVHRDCNPEVVLYDWSRLCARYLKFEFSAEKIYKIRKNIERNLKKENDVQELSYDVLITNIAQELGLKDEIERREFCEHSKNWEITSEVRHLSIDQECISYVEQLVKERQHVIIISDFYASLEIISAILTKLEVIDLFDKIYVSSEYNCRKSTGDLYQYVLKDLSILPEELEMNGDNETSDFLIPQKMGIKSNLRVYKNSYPGISESDFDKKFKSFLFMNKGQLNGYGGEILLFIERLYRSLIKDGHEAALFCSREGQMIKKIFDDYQKIFYGDDFITTEYFYISRKASLAPSLKKLDEEDFATLFRQYRNISVDDLLSSIGLSNIADILKDSGLKGDSIISREKNDANLARLKSSQVFSYEYEKRRTDQAKYFEQYTESLFRPNKNNEIAIVDIGWKGTIQDCLQRMVRDKYIIKGYYLGLITNEFECINLNNKKGILFSDYPERSSFFSILSSHYMFYERIFVANHGPVIGYKEDSGHIVQPIIDDRDQELKLFQFLKKDQSELLITVNKVAKLYANTYKEVDNDLDRIVKSSLWRQCVYSARNWRILIESRNVSRENFGNISTNGKELNPKEKKHSESEVLYADYIFRFLDKLHLRFLYPLAEIYGRCAYMLKLLTLSRSRGVR